MPKTVTIDVPVSYSVTYVPLSGDKIKSTFVREDVSIDIDVSEGIESFARAQGLLDSEDIEKKIIGRLYHHNGLLYRNFRHSKRGDKLSIDDYMSIMKDKQRSKSFDGFFNRDEKGVPEEKRGTLALPQWKNLKYKEIVSSDRNLIESQFGKFKNGFITDGEFIFVKSDSMPAFIVKTEHKHDLSIEYEASKVLDYKVTMPSDIYVGIDDFLNNRDMIFRAFGVDRRGGLRGEEERRVTAALRFMESLDIDMQVERRIDPFAHSIIDMCAAACRISFVSSGHSVMDADKRFLQIAREMRAKLPGYQQVLTKEAADLAASDLLGSLVQLRETLIDDHRGPFRDLALILDARLELIKGMRPHLLLNDEMSNALSF